MDGQRGGGRTAARVRGVQPRGAGRAVRAAAAHARGAGPAAGAAEQSQHAGVSRLPRWLAGHVGGPCCEYI